jgi:hypothetical protein
MLRLVLIAFVASCAASDTPPFDFQATIQASTGQQVTVDGSATNRVVVRHLDSYDAALAELHVPVVVTDQGTTHSLDLTAGFCESLAATAGDVDFGALTQETVTVIVTPDARLDADYADCRGTKAKYIFVP